MSSPDPFAEAGEADELRQAVRNLQRRLATAKARTADLVEAVHVAAREAAVTVGRPKVPTVAKDRRRKREEVALVHATDWQCGKRTGTFDSDVLAARIGALAGKVAKITEVQRTDHPVRRCVLLLGGDMVEGTAIFPGQAFEVDSTLYEQLFTAARIVEQLVVDLLATFEQIDIVCEYGNHGRLGRKGDYPGQDNIDLFMYRIVAERLTDPRVSWQFSTDWRQLFQIGAYHGLLVHGDEIKSFGGNTPAFGILRKGTAWGSGVVPDFADVYMGHFHTPMTLTMPNGNQIYVTGSPESDNPYAAEFVAARGHPSQRLHFIDPDAGRVTASYLVWLDE